VVDRQADVWPRRRAWARCAHPTQVVDVLLRTGRHRISLRKLKRSPHGLDLGPLQPSLPGALATRNKRIDLIPKLLVDDLPRLEQAIDTGTDSLVLVGRRHLRSNNSWMHNSQRLVKGSHVTSC
jgi:hypothetical protein